MQKSSILLDSPRFLTASVINHKNSTVLKKCTDANFTEIIFIEHGRADFIFDDKSFVGRAGDLIILNPLSNIEGKSYKDDPLKGISICFSNLHINGNQKGFLIESTELPVIHLQEEKMELHYYLRAILSEYDAKRAGYQDVTSSILQTVVIKVTRLLENGNQTSLSSVCLEVKKYIEKNFRQDLTLNDLASLVYVSPYHLAHVFKEEVGLPPIQYMIHCRIEEAKRLLEHSNLSVREIALVIGYENANYFNLLFKKMTGSPPGKFRRMKA